MRILLITTCLANIAFAFGTLPWLPESVGFMYAMKLSIYTVIMTVPPLCTRWIMAIPLFQFGTPNRNYWYNEANRSQTIRRTCFCCDSIGVWGLLSCLFVQWEFFLACQRIPKAMSTLNVSLIICVPSIFIIIQLVRFYLSFRLPKENKPKENHEISPF